MVIGGFLFYQINKIHRIIDMTTLSVKTDSNLSVEKVKVKFGIYSINRVNDAVLFLDKSDAKFIDDTTIFDGKSKDKFETCYGENDFLVTYDDKYYYQFRQFILNCNDQHDYKFYVFKKDNSIFLKVAIVGKDGMDFVREMNLIENAINLRCNAPIDKNKVIYNMKELK